jgi:hypothetical protein
MGIGEEGSPEARIVGRALRIGPAVVRTGDAVSLSAKVDPSMITFGVAAVDALLM